MTPAAMPPGPAPMMQMENLFKSQSPPADCAAKPHHG
jgi:hypothetical protein